MAKAMAKARSWTSSQGKHKARQTKGAGKKKKGTGKDAAKGSGKTGKSVKLGQAAFVANRKSRLHKAMVQQTTHRISKLSTDSSNRKHLRVSKLSTDSSSRSCLRTAAVYCSYSNQKGCTKGTECAFLHKCNVLTSPTSVCGKDHPASKHVGATVASQ